MEIDQWVISAIVVKFGIYVTSFIAAGTAIFWRVVDPQSELTKSYFKIILPTALSAMVLTALQVSIRAGLLIDDGFAGMLDGEMLALAIEGPMGQSVGALALGLMLLIIAELILSLRELLLFAGAFLIALSFSLIGHATDEPRWLLTVFITIHLLAVSFWIGALIPLYASVRSTPSKCAELAHRFGHIASFVVPALIFMGIGFVAVRFGGPFALIGSSYGAALLIKLIIVGVLLLLAAMNKLRLVPAMRQGDQTAALNLQKTIFIEAICFAGIFLLTAFLTTAAELPS